MSRLIAFFLCIIVFIMVVKVVVEEITFIMVAL